jgi:hypothetical protein
MSFYKHILVKTVVNEKDMAGLVIVFEHLQQCSSWPGPEFDRRAGAMTDGGGIGLRKRCASVGDDETEIGLAGGSVLTMMIEFDSGCCL